MSAALNTSVVAPSIDRRVRVRTVWRKATTQELEGTDTRTRLYHPTYPFSPTCFLPRSPCNLVGLPIILHGITASFASHSTLSPFSLFFFFCSVFLFAEMGFPPLCSWVGPPRGEVPVVCGSVSTPPLSTLCFHSSGRDRRLRPEQNTSTIKRRFKENPPTGQDTGVTTLYTCTGVTTLYTCTGLTTLCTCTGVTTPYRCDYPVHLYRWDYPVYLYRCTG